MRFGQFPLVAFLLLFTLCSSASAQNSNVSISFDFRQGALGWQAGFADWSTQTNYDSFEFRSEILSLPAELQAPGTGFYIQSHNRTDDVFMFLKRKLGPAEGIVPGQKYQLYLTIVFASNAQNNCFGAGGAPGESVGLKAGATPIEPIAVLDASGWWRMNVNKGGPTGPGELVATGVSSIANGLPCNLQSRPYVSLTRHHLHRSLVTASPAGELWLLLGTDSGFEGLTGLYYESVDVLLVPMSEWPETPDVLQLSNSGEGVVVDSVTHAAGLPEEDVSAVTATAEDAQHRVFPLTVEYTGRVPTFDWLDQVIVKLPDELRNAGDLKISVRVHGANSNSVTVRMKP